MSRGELFRKAKNVMLSHSEHVSTLLRGSQMILNVFVHDYFHEECLRAEECVVLRLCSARPKTLRLGLSPIDPEIIEWVEVQVSASTRTSASKDSNVAGGQSSH